MGSQLSSLLFFLPFYHHTSHSHIQTSPTFKALILCPAVKSQPPPVCSWEPQHLQQRQTASQHSGFSLLLSSLCPELCSSLCSGIRATCNLSTSGVLSLHPDFCAGRALPQISGCVKSVSYSWTHRAEVSEPHTAFSKQISLSHFLLHSCIFTVMLCIRAFLP